MGVATRFPASTAVNEDEFRKGPAADPAIRNEQGRFEKGRSGNPSGRPAVVKTIQELARAHGPRAIQAIAELATGSQDEKIRLAAWRELLDRGYGRAPQAITGEGGEGPAVIIIDSGIARDAGSAAD